MLLLLYAFVAAVLARGLVRLIRSCKRKPAAARAVTWRCTRCKALAKGYDLPLTCSRGPCPMEVVFDQVIEAKA